MSILSSFLGYKAASKTAKAEQQAGQLAADAASAGVAENARQFDITRSYYDPIYNDSRAAAGLYNAALGIPSMTGINSNPGGAPAGREWDAYLTANPDVAAAAQREIANPNSAYYGKTPEQFARGHYLEYGQNDGHILPASINSPTGGATQPSMTQAGIATMVQNTPGYQAQLSEGLKAVDRAAPLRGGMYSGRRMKALDDYGQNTFGSYYQNWLDRVGGVAGTGTGAASGVTGAGQAATANSNALRMTGASAQGNAKTNAANTWAGFYGDTAGSIQNFGRSLMTMGG